MEKNGSRKRRKRPVLIKFLSGLLSLITITFFSSPQFIKYIIIFPLLACGLWCYLTVIPFYFITTLKIPTQFFGYYIVPTTVMYSVGSMMAPGLIQKYGLTFTLKTGIRLCLFAAISHLMLHFLAPGNIFWIVGIQSFYVMGMAIVFAPSISKAVEPFHRNRATANSLGGMLRQSCAGLGSLAGGFFDDSSMVSVALFLIVLSGGAMIVFSYLHKYQSQS